MLWAWHIWSIQRRVPTQTPWWFSYQMVIWSSQSVGKQPLLPPRPCPHLRTSTFTLVGFRYILSCYLGFGEHACTHHYHICVKLWDLPPLQVPYTLLLAGCIAISVLKNPLCVHEILVKLIKEPFRWQSSYILKFWCLHPHVSLFLVETCWNYAVTWWPAHHGMAMVASPFMATSARRERRRWTWQGWGGGLHQSLSWYICI